MKQKSTVGIVFAALWVCIVSTGALLLATSKLLGWPDFRFDSHLEKRDRLHFPDLSRTPVKKWGSSIDRWYSDNFAWRSDVITFYKDLHFNVFKSPLRSKVPGRGKWIFGRTGTWPEVEDYMGVIKLDDEMIDDWRILFEGRVAYAEAHGCHYLQLVTPLKANVHPEKMLPMITRHRRRSFREDMREAMSGSPAETNMLFLIDQLSAEVAKGREVYYEEDHHENAYGCWCIYRDMIARMRELWFPDLVDFPFYDAPVPEGVLNGSEPGCWVNDERRLVVSNPDASVANYRPLSIRSRHPRFPHCPVCVEFPGAPDRSIVVCHDSFLRYPFSTWYRRDSMPEFAIPVGDCFRYFSMFIFTRLDTERIDGYFSRKIPDVLVEQFSEGRLQFGPVGLDDTMRRAAEWGRGRPLASTDDIADGDAIAAMAVFDSVSTSSDNEFVKASLVNAEGRPVASAEIRPGVRRAAFFGLVPDAGGCRVVLDGGTAASTNLSFRAVRQRNARATATQPMEPHENQPPL